MVTDKRAFEMYGYDVLLDDTLEPWIIEVNASPSISADTPDDYKLKFGLLEDMLGVVDLEGRRSGLETRVGGFDLVWNDGPVMMPAKGPFPPVRNSHLGGDLSDRQSNLELVLNSNGGTGAAKPAA
jgi:tubulin polyglutamylase TTLL9